MRGLISALILLGCIQMFGQEIRKEVCIGFPVGSSALDETYGDNAARLSGVVSFLESVRKDSSLELVEVSFSGSASPEGRFAINRKLAKKRRNSLEYYIRERVPLPDSIISRLEESIAWERLAQLVEASDMPHREEAVDVLRNVPEFTCDNKGALIDSRKKHLMELQYGRTWHYMHKHFFDRIRNASVILVTVRQKPEIEEKTVVREEPVVLTPADTTAVAEKADTVAAVSPETSSPFYMALKTNMLYDVLAVPNIGVEFYLGGNWSVSGNWMYGWWKKDSSHRYWRIYGGDIAVRYWFGRKAHEKPLTGHHVGIYGQVFTYDFEWGGKGYMGGRPGGTLWEKMNYAAGVEYGYSLPIARRLNIDFTIGLGYWGGKYYKYIPMDGHYVWQATRNRHWFGPTKAEISLVWLLGRGNSNNKKGGVK
ncbi:MAG: DUF3575 domain-containing protein [Prevotella sp.]